MPDPTMPRELFFALSGVAASVGVAGLIFALYRYIKSRESQAILQLELTAELHKVQRKTLCDITIHVKNVGKAAVYVPSEQQHDATCSVRSVPIVKLNGRIEWEDLQQHSVIENLQYLNDKDWDSYYKDAPFIFEPGATDQYHVFFVTDQAGLLWVRAILEDKNEDKWRADRVFLIPEQEQVSLVVASNPPPNTDTRLKPRAG